MIRQGKEPAISSSNQAILTVTAQQSRYAADAVDAPESKEIIVKDLSITLGDREILSHALLNLQGGRHYVLVGRNGTGKSTLLKAIAEGRVPGIPWSLRILLLGHTLQPGNLEDSLETLGLGKTSVLEHVVKSDKKRERLLKEADALSNALETSTDSLVPVRTYRKIQHARLERRLEEAKRIAERRSGARGKNARKVQITLEEELEVSQSKLEENLEEIGSAQVSEDTQAAVEMLADMQSSLQLMHSSQASSKARIVLLGLGFPEEWLNKPISTLSGGWTTRCDIACALYQPADVLLLDEPTNFLDLPSIIWLQEYIRTLKCTTVVVTHDRSFADAVAEELIVLRNLVLEPFRGNLSLYERERYKKARYLTKMRDAQDKQKDHMEKTIQNNIKVAKRTGDDKKLKQAVSRRKKLDDRMGLQVSARGGHFKLNRDLTGYHSTMRAEIDIPDFEPPVRLSFPMTPVDLRFPGSLVSLEKVSYTYPGKSSKVILDEVDLTIHPQERVGLVGLNGSGKTTLVTLLTGSDEEGQGETLKPTKGFVQRHSRVRIGRFSQRAVEELEVVAQSNPALTALAHVLSTWSSSMTEKDARGLLSSLGLQGQIASEVSISMLSRGQKVRVALACLLWNPPHLLVLDEVTTHLDSDTINALAQVLKRYEGAVLVVSHDRFFVHCVVEGCKPSRYSRGPIHEMEDEESSEDSEGKDQKTSGTVYRLFKGKLIVLDGGMKQYEEIAAKGAAKLMKNSPP